MGEQGQLWNAGTVRVFSDSQAKQRSRDAWKVASGQEKLRMEKRRASKLGLSVKQYRELCALRKVCSALARAGKWTPPDKRLCVECGLEFETRHGHQKLCGSEECRKAYQNKRVSASIMRRYYADDAFRDEVISRAQSRRATKLGLGGAKITVRYLLERDFWRCGICGRKIKSFDQASIDHIVPLSVGGLHELANVQASHRKCNYAKGNRGGGEQTRLVG